MWLIFYLCDRIFRLHITIDDGHHPRQVGVNHCQVGTRPEFKDIATAKVVRIFSIPETLDSKFFFP
jgi:hypothetical protein